jgi:hypothetical protein
MWVNSVPLFQSHSEGNRILRSGISMLRDTCTQNFNLEMFWISPTSKTEIHCRMTRIWVLGSCVVRMGTDKTRLESLIITGCGINPVHPSNLFTVFVMTLLSRIASVGNYIPPKL